MNEPSDDDLLEAIARGELTPEELGALRARADEDAEAKAMLEAASPLGSDFADRVTASILAQQGAKGAQESANDRPVAEPAAPQRPRAAPPLRASRWQLISVGATALAVAAAAALVLWPRGGGSVLGGYAITLSRGAQTVRGSTEPARPVPVFLPETRLEIVLSPPTAIEGAVTARLYVRDANGTLEALAARPEIAPTGAVRIAVAAGELLGARRGRLTLLAVIAREGASEDELRECAEAGEECAEVAELELVDAID